MIGHSIGEYVAACISGVYGLGETLDLLYHRLLYMTECSEGAMLAAYLSVEEAEKYTSELISLSAINSHTQCVFSGSVEDIKDLQSVLNIDGIATKCLKSKYAVHSRYMIGAAKKINEYAKSIIHNSASVPYISCVTGDWFMENGEDYWGRHMTDTVRFYDGIMNLSKKDSIFIEIGPGSTLLNLIKGDTLKGNHLYQSTMTFESERNNMLSALSCIWMNQGDIEWEKFYNNREGYTISLPTYQFEKNIVWVGKPYSSVIEDTRESSSKDELHFDELQSAICLLWQEMLGIKRVQLNDDFFSLSGNSMLAVQLISCIYNIYKVEISLDTIYTHSTPQKICDVLCQYIDYGELIRISKEYIDSIDH